jgi:hypothetical protein
MMAVGARANNLTQAPDALNRQLGMGVFKMGWISKTTMQELDGVQAVLQLLHEPFIFVHAGPSLSFNLHLNCNTVQHAESRESEGQQFDCVVGRIEQPVQGRAAVTHPLGHLHLCDVAFKHSLFDLPYDHFLGRDGAGLFQNTLFPQKLIKRGPYVFVPY